MRALRALLALLLGVGLLGLAACGADPDSGSVYATPTGYYGANGYCYYLTDPGEVLALQQAGLCPWGWRPMLAPSAWEATYWGFYHYSGYGTRYVPVGSRQTYVTVINNYGSQHKGDITKAQASYAVTRQQQRQQSSTTYGSSGRGDRAGGASSSSRSSSTRSYSSGGRK